MSEDVKKIYNLNGHSEIFKRVGGVVPETEDEFRKLALDPKFQLMSLKMELFSIGITKDELDENYPEKADVIDLFLEKFDVVYKNGKSSTDVINNISRLNVSVLGTNSTDSTTEGNNDSTRDAFTGKDNKDEKDATDEAASNIIFDEPINFSIGCIRSFFKKLDVTPEAKNIKSKTTTIKENLDISIHDSFIIDIKDDIEVYENLVLITDSENKNVAAVGKIINAAEKKNNKYFIAEKSNIEFVEFDKKTKFNIVLFDKASEEFFKNPDNLLSLPTDNKFNYGVYCKEVRIEMEKMRVEKEKFLCIDFGTSNTTVGCYGILDENSLEPEIVDFSDTINNNIMSKLCPTVVYVKDCSDDDNIQYLFGYDARKMVIINNYDTEADVFYELKMWVGDETTIPIHDENGNKTIVTKKSIIKAYLEYIIENAQNYFKVQFKKLHFTSPVKMKSKFIREMNTLLSGKYEISSEEDTIDEAVAIIYDYLYDKEITNGSNETQKSSVVVLDCGGGTTDLATCDYTCANTESGYKELKLSTQFENGNSDFGGNNITYKIMKLIKIKMAMAYKKIDLEEYEAAVEKYSEKDILSIIDSKINEQNSKATINANSIEVYAKFNELYNKCENFIPTRFEDNEDFVMDEDKRNIKRNFYYLWQFAEKVKLAFYQEDKVLVKFQAEDKNIDISGMAENDYLYINNDSDLVKQEKPSEHISVSINDIRKIICGDIYALLNNILPDEPEKFDYYRLSGQSCRINLFNELLKEFIPGRKLRMKMDSSKKDENSIDLKLKCIKGSVNYRANKEHGKFQISTSSAIPKLIYGLYCNDNQNKMFSEERKNAIVYNLTKDQKYMDIAVKNQAGDLVREVKHPIFIADSECKSVTIIDIEITLMLETSLADIDTFKPKIKSLTPNDNESDARVSFALPSKDAYGFIVYYLTRKFDADGKSEYLISDGKYYDYDAGNNSFFDGRR